MSEEELINEVITLRKISRRACEAWWDNGWSRAAKKYSYPGFGFRLKAEDLRYNRRRQFGVAKASQPLVNAK